DVVRIDVSNASLEIRAGAAVLDITDASGTLLLKADGVAGRANGLVILSGVDGLSLRSSLDLEFNNTGGSVDETIGTTVLDYTSADQFDFFSVSGSAELGIASSFNVDGQFALTRSRDSGGGVTLTAGLISTVETLDVLLGLMLFDDGTFAAIGEMSAGLTPIVADLALAGALGVRVNTTGREDIDETIDVDGTPINLLFGAGEGNIVQLEGTGIVLLTPIADLTGSLFFEKDLATNELFAAGSGIEVFVGARNGAGASDDAGLRIGSGAFALLLKPNGTYAFSASGSPELVNLTSAFTFSAGQLAAEVNTTGADVNRSLSIDHTSGTLNATLDVAAGLSRFSGTGITLQTPAGDVSGSFAVERSTAGPDGVVGTVDDATEVLIGATGVSVNVPTASPVVQVSDGEFVLLLTENNDYAFQAQGQAAVVGITELSFSGNLGLEYNTLTEDVMRTIRVGDVDVLLNVAAAADASTPFTRFGGSGVELSVLGQSLRGDFTIVANGMAVDITVANASLNLGDGVLTATGASADLALDDTSILGTFALDNVTLNVPGIQLSGAVSGTIDFTDDATENDSVSVTVGTMGTPASLTVFGQTLSGVFLFEQGTNSDGDTVIRGAASDVGLTLGDGTTDFVTITDGSGEFIVSDAGVAAALRTSTMLNVPDLFTSTFDIEVQLNTTSSVVNETFVIDMADVALSLPAGPFLRVKVNASGANKIVFDGHEIEGDFFFEQSTRPGPDGLVDTENPMDSVNDDNEVGVLAAATNVSVKFFGDTDPTLVNGEGAVVVNSNGFAGFISGTANVAAAGVAIGGSVLLRVNTTGDVVNEAINVNGVDLEIAFGPGEEDVFALSVSDLSLNIANVVTIEGDISFTSLTLPGDVVVESFAGANLTIFFGEGPATLANGNPNPLARGLLLTDASVALIKDGGTLPDASDDLFALDASGTVQLVGLSGVTLAGTVRVRINGFDTELDETLTIPGTENDLFIRFQSAEVASTPDDPFVSVRGIGLELSILGQTLSGDFGFEKITLDPNTTPGDPTDDIDGLFLTAANVELAIGDGATDFVRIIDGAGELLITPDGVAGGVGGTLEVNLPGVSTSATFDLLINTTDSAVSHTFDLNGGSLTSLPAGPFVRLSADNVMIDVLGQQLTGDFFFEQSQDPSGQTTTRLAADNVTLTLGDGTTDFLTLNNGAGAFLLTSDG
ncbi:MAG: beta strand repeat-containing protein, partial [Planctomycetota bacterium]